MSIQFDVPSTKTSIIKVIGVGGGGGNAVNHMFRQGIVGVNFVVCNTDQQALDLSPVPFKIQLGSTISQGNGAGMNPEVGKRSTIEALDEIMKVLAHRYPFLLVDRILEMDDKRVVGIKNVTINEPFFQGHFPGHPIMPGVLIIEAMAQVGGMLLMGAVPNPENKVVYFTSLNDVRFRQPVKPGDQLIFELEVLQVRGMMCKMRGVAKVDGKVVCEAEMGAVVRDK
jgi:beta-hydroxyacyl-ACP dehydratase FabZ